MIMIILIIKDDDDDAENDNDDDSDVAEDMIWNHIDFPEIGNGAGDFFFGLECVAKACWTGELRAHY